MLWQLWNVSFATPARVELCDIMCGRAVLLNCAVIPVSRTHTYMCVEITLTQPGIMFPCFLVTALFIC